MVDIEKLSNILGADTVKKIYDDGVSQPVRETGKIATDFIKAARLFTAPIQLLASYQDRLTAHFERVRKSVKEENQIEAPASISGPIIDRLKYLEDNNYLTDLYINLLSRAIDKERINEAHPAFYHIIDQLAPDEAMLLYLLNQNTIKYEYTLEHIHDEKGRFIQWGQKEILLDTTPKDKFMLMDYFFMYVEHLRALNLTYWDNVKQEGIFDGNFQTHALTRSEIGLTTFGKLFVKACIPEHGFIIQS
jgi:hypothetical protein